jgi:hypothetical protein
VGGLLLVVVVVVELLGGLGLLGLLGRAGLGEGEEGGADDLWGRGGGGGGQGRDGEGAGGVGPFPLHGVADPGVGVEGGAEAVDALEEEGHFPNGILPAEERLGEVLVEGVLRLGGEEAVCVEGRIGRGWRCVEGRVVVVGG